MVEAMGMVMEAMVLEAMVDMVVEAMVVMDVEVLVGTVMEVMVDMGVEAMVDTVMEAMVVTVMEAMVVTVMEAMVKAAIVVVMGRVATDMVQVMDILETKAIIVIVHLLIKIMHIHSQEITNHNLTINLKHMPNLRRILKLMPSLKRIPNLKHMIILKHTVSHKPIPTLIHRQLTLKLVIVMVLIINSIQKHKLRLRMDFERLMHAFNL